MAVTITEAAGSGVRTAGTSPSAELRYHVNGTSSDSTALSLVEAASPATYEGLFRQSWRVEPLEGGSIWEATVTYGAGGTTGESTFQFSTTGGQQRVTQSLATVSTGVPPNHDTTPDFARAINVTENSAEGVDITVPVSSFTETHYLPASAVTGAYKAVVFRLTGRVNGSPWRGFAAGEVLFLGAEGSRRGGGDWELSFKFAASPNVAGQTIGDCSPVDKEGWHLLWIRYEDIEDESARMLVKRPRAVYVEQVYEYADFTQLGIGS